MKGLVNRIARSFGYEIHKLPPAIPRQVTKLLDAPETSFELADDLDLGRAERAGAERAWENAPRSGRGLDRVGASANWIVEGWRFLPHSYAVVNQWQLLALSRRKEIGIKVVDIPFFGPRWRAQQGLFDPRAEEVLQSFPAAEADESADVTLRIFFPYDFSPSRSALTAVFGTAESQVIQRVQLADFRAYDQLKRRRPPTNVRAITPSRWSAEGFYKAGFREEQVLVIPHGVDVDVFRPMPHLRNRIRRAVEIGDDEFVFLSVGAMTGNKGVGLLVRAFAEVSRRFPRARLVLKGMDALYRSKNFLLKVIQSLPPPDQERVAARMTYIGRSLSNHKMALLYQTADCYVSPYKAEGFNIPVLEAAASGAPIICTSGGSTDDFVTDEFAHKIESEKVLIPVEDQEVSQLEPNLDHLIELMASALEDSSWRSRAAEAGPRHVAAHYTWDRVVDLMIEKLST